MRSARVLDDYFADLEQRWFVLYRFFDAKGALLYVGITNEMTRRVKEHSTEKEWFREVVRADLEHVFGRSAALEREREAIRTEGPRWNLQGKPDAPVRVLVCGSRAWNDRIGMRLRLSLLPLKSTVIHGGARGVDTIAGKLAAETGHTVEVFPADWKTYAKRAGIIRNVEMLDTAPDGVIAFWDGVSKGTKHTIDEARKRGIAVEVRGPGDRDYSELVV